MQNKVFVQRSRRLRATSANTESSSSHDTHPSHPPQETNKRREQQQKPQPQHHHHQQQQQQQQEFGGERAVGKQKRKRKRLVIYQRDSSRQFVDLGGIVDSLLGATDPEAWDMIVLLHHEHNHPCMLHWVLKDADILLTTHGFQSTGSNTVT
jgi:hypothetical protein